MQKRFRDLAILIFPSPTGRVTYPICDFQPKVGTDALLVGYGKTYAERPSNEEHYQYKGYAEINEINDQVGQMRSAGQIAYTTGDGSNAASARGDSGGPMFVNRSQNEICIIGTVSMGSVQNGLKHSLYENIVHPENRAFLQQFNMFPKKMIDIPFTVVPNGRDRFNPVSNPTSEQPTVSNPGYGSTTGQLNSGSFNNSQYDCK